MLLCIRCIASGSHALLSCYFYHSIFTLLSFIFLYHLFLFFLFLSNNNNDKACACAVIIASDNFMFMHAVSNLNTIVLGTNVPRIRIRCLFIHRTDLIIKSYSCII